MTSILFLTSGPQVPSTRFRVLQFLPRFEADGFRVRVAHCRPQKYLSHYDFRFGGRPLGAALTLAKGASRFLAALRAPGYDVVFLERELLPRTTPLLEEFVRSLNRSIHFDFDDAIHLRYGDAPDNPVARVVSMSRSVSAGNEWLASWARRFSERVSVVPTAIDTERFTPGPGGDVPFVWTGTSSNLKYLEQAAPALRRVPGARILVVCDRPPGDLGVPVEYVPWSEGAEVDAIRRGRVGIMPLPDEEWTKGKCGFKLLQYMACGIPCVASPVGVNPEILREGGLLAPTEDAWVEALARLARDEEAARRMGAAGRRRVEEAYSVRAIYPKLRDALTCP